MLSTEGIDTHTNLSRSTCVGRRLTATDDADISDREDLGPVCFLLFAVGMYFNIK